MGRVTAPTPVIPVPPADLPGTLGELRAAGHQYRTVKQELRDNLLARMRSGEPRFPGIVGYDDTVLPEVERALLAGHDMVLLGERGQGKTRLIRSLVALLDEWTPVIAGSELNEHPLHPITPASRAAGRRGRRRPAGRPGCTARMRYGEKLATPDTSVGDLIGDVDPIRVAQGRTLGDPETIHFGLVPRTNRGIFAVNELPDLAERIQVSLLNVLEERDIQVRGYQLRLPLDLLLVASANPEDYTNRGRIITPLKDRFGAEIRTHYPLDLELELDAGPPGGRRWSPRCRSTCWRCWPGSPARSASRRRWTPAPASRPGSPSPPPRPSPRAALRRGRRCSARRERGGPRSATPCR